MKRGFIPSTYSTVDIVGSIDRLKEKGVLLENISCNISFEEFNAILAPGDEVYLLSFIDMNFSMSETMSRCCEMANRSIMVYSLAEPKITFSDEHREFFVALNNLESKIRTIRTKQGLIKAKADGKKLGRPLGSTTIDASMIENITKYREAGMSVEKACKLVGCEPRTYYRHMENYV